MNEQQHGRVVLKRLAQGNTTYEVSVPSSGGSPAEMREAVETAKTIYDELNAAFNPRRERLTVDENGGPY